MKLLPLAFKQARPLLSSFLRLDAMHIKAERVFFFVRIGTNHQGGKGGVAATLGPSRRGLPLKGCSYIIKISQNPFQEVDNMSRGGFFPP